MRIEKIMAFASVGLLLTGCGEAPSGKYSRGVGIYPGNPDETFAPELVEDNETYRNVAALKAAWHSSSYDYNLTAQLVTDGIISTEEPKENWRGCQIPLCRAHHALPYGLRFYSTIF